jgi:hypothetical protein
MLKIETLAARALRERISDKQGGITLRARNIAKAQNHIQTLRAERATLLNQLNSVNSQIFKASVRVEAKVRELRIAEENKVRFDNALTVVLKIEGE